MSESMRNFLLIEFNINVNIVIILQGMLQTEQRIRLLRIPSNNEEYAIVLTEDYKKAIEYLKRIESMETAFILG
jgi:hypothetical protein